MRPDVDTVDTRPAGRFAVKVYQNPHLPVDADELHAIARVDLLLSPEHGTVAARPPEAAVVIIIDCSGSMSYPESKIAAARRAALAAIDTLRPGDRFAIVEGTSLARVVYPADERMVEATTATADAAKQAVAGLIAGGGTSMAAWLTRALALLERVPGAVRHAILLTDGANHDPPGSLDRALAACHGRFTCDACGVGEDWKPQELLEIAAELHGSASAVRQPSELAAHFRQMMTAVTGKVIAEVELQVEPRRGSQVRFLRQVHPRAVDLTGRAAPGGGVRYAAGSWAPGWRDYHLCLRINAADVPQGEEVRVANIDLVVDDQPEGKWAVVAQRTDDPMLSTRIEPRFAHYTGQAELSRIAAAGCDAYEAGNWAAARAKLLEAHRLAKAAGNAKLLDALGHLLVVGDRGQLTLRKDGRLESKITWLSVVDSQPFDPTDRPDPSGPARTCRCGRISPAAARFCEKCGERLGGAAEPGASRAETA